MKESDSAGQSKGYKCYNIGFNIIDIITQFRCRNSALSFFFLFICVGLFVFCFCFCFCKFWGGGWVHKLWFIIEKQKNKRKWDNTINESFSSSQIQNISPGCNAFQPCLQLASGLERHGKKFILCIELGHGSYLTIIGLRSRTLKSSWLLVNQLVSCILILSLLS